MELPWNHSASMEAPSDLHRSHGSSMILPWDFMGLSWSLCGFSSSYGTPMEIPRDCHGTFMKLVWFFHGTSMLFTWNYGILMGIPWDIHGTTKEVPYNYMRIPWDLHGISMGAPWDYNGTHPYQTTKYAHSGFHGKFPQQWVLWVFLSCAFLWKSIEIH